jgi:hypothetical protein
MNHQPLNHLHGAPLRLRVENQLGFKMVKRIRAIEFVEDVKSIYRGEGDYAEDHEYFGELANTSGRSNVKSRKSPRLASRRRTRSNHRVLRLPRMLALSVVSRCKMVSASLRNTDVTSGPFPLRMRSVHAAIAPSGPAPPGIKPVKIGWQP